MFTKRKAARLLLKGAAALTAAAAIGLGTAWLAVAVLAQPSSVRNGPWITPLLEADSASNPYRRAHLAVFGGGGLNRKEAIYFGTSEDGEGEPLRGGCDYVIEGRSLDARWWSLTAYGPDRFLIANDVGRYSYTSLGLGLKPGDPFTIQMSPAPKIGNWLPAGQADHLRLVLRVYNPGPGVTSDIATASLPAITREACQ
jgi:hypothetical protein